MKIFKGVFFVRIFSDVFWMLFGRGSRCFCYFKFFSRGLLNGIEVYYFVLWIRVILIWFTIFFIWSLYWDFLISFLCLFLGMFICFVLFNEFVWEVGGCVDGNKRKYILGKKFENFLSILKCFFLFLLFLCRVGVTYKFAVSYFR